VISGFSHLRDDRLLTGLADNEDAAVVRFPEGKALVQTLDFLTPIVNNPYWFGQIGAANSLSDVYAMGGEPYTAMNIVCYPIETMGKEVLRRILEGGMDKIRESGAVMAGGHSVRDKEIKYGLSVTGIVDPAAFSSNRGLRPGDHLLLTKPIGTGVLATALKADFGDSAKIEELIYRWAGRLNKAGGAVIQKLGLKGATDVTGFGLGGHALELAKASGVSVELWLDKIPFIPEAVELAGMGMFPAGSTDNRNFCHKLVEAPQGADPILVDLAFDAQTSGGLILSVPEDKLTQARDLLLEAGDLAAHIGQVLPDDPAHGKLRLL
jgi:selenide,water dikinase